MRRAERLSQLVQILRGRRLATAAYLSAQLQVSERTVYRDVNELVETGVPIEGEAGVGYRLGKHFELSPLKFEVEELEALVLGMRMVGRWGDRDLARSAKNVLRKIESVLPDSERNMLESSALFAYSFQITDAVRKTLRSCRRGVSERRKLTVNYRDELGRDTRRVLRPLGLFFWGETWTLAAYCELREGFRNFRLDRMRQMRLTRVTFELKSPITMADYIKAQSTAR